MKKVVQDLAIFGGQPAFSRPLVVGRPGNVARSRFFQRVDAALDRGWLTNDGPLVQEFETRVAEISGVRHCIATCNGTAGLQLLHVALGQPEGEVIMPAMTYIATAHAARMVGMHPVFCDVDPTTGCLDPAALETAVTSRTRSVMGVHVWGQPCDTDGLAALANVHQLNLLFDAAHAFGSRRLGKPIGGFGRAEVFSFHATKVVHTFEGGAVVTDDDDLAEHLRSLRAFGAGRDRSINGPGTNAKMSEVAAAMGLTSLEAFAGTVAHNQVNHVAYRTELSGVAGVEVMDYGPQNEPNYQYVVLTIDRERTGIHRDQLMDVLGAERIFTQRYFSPACHQLEPYRSEGTTSLPHTERIADQVLALPTGPAVSTDNARRISDLIRMVLRNGPEVASRLTNSTRTPASRPAERPSGATQDAGEPA